MNIEAIEAALDQAIEAIEFLCQTINDVKGIERVPEPWMGISYNPYVNDNDCNDPNSRAMRWHNKLMAMHEQRQTEHFGVKE